MNKALLNWLKETLIVIIGNALMGFAYLFILRANLMVGGMGGIAIVFEKLWGIDVSLIILIMTWVLFVIGLVVLGKKFALKTIVSSIFYPIFVFVFMYIPTDFIKEIATNDVANQLLYSITSGCLSGIGLGMVFKTEGSTGGVDVIIMIIHKKTKIGIDKLVFALDGMIIAAGLLVINWESVMIGLIGAYVASVLIERVIIGGSETIVVQIISKYHQEINVFILDHIDRGVTYIPAVGGYHSEERIILQTVLSRREYPVLMDYIHKIDKKAFVTTYNGKDIYGNGFKKI